MLFRSDHYKWRAMRANGVSEEFITGHATAADKFDKWAATVPYTFRNPLYHWTHLELQRYFGINEILNPSSASSIYQSANQQLTSAACSPRSLLTQMNVAFVGTTDDPTDNLSAHQQLRNEGFSIQVSPTFRPDKAMAVENGPAFLAYLKKLEACTNQSISDFNSYVEALHARHDFFNELGCVASDHGVDQLYCHSFTEIGRAHV